ncbi:MAG: LLM class flavin-dependent oxidoreductase [Proteobacteria bacterium]|nr:LLM class flavin-dependent oxidoreductase [Pseudomonadota bacterium]
MFGVDFAERGRFMDESLEVIKKAWTREPFEYRG